MKLEISQRNRINEQQIYKQTYHGYHISKIHNGNAKQKLFMQISY